MIMYEELLTDIGLTKSEISVYFALLDLGSSTTGPIIKKAGIASGKAYLILDKLIMKGLVTHVIKSGTKYYQAKDPERLLDYLRDKESELKDKKDKLREILPKIRAKYDNEKYKPIAEVYEGVKGFKTFYDWSLNQLKSGDSIDILGVPLEGTTRFNDYFINWNQRRIEKKIKMKIIYNSDAKEFGKLREKLKLTEVRYMKKELETPAWIVLFKDYIVTINVHHEPVCFLIRNKESADSYQKYFEIMWKQSKK